MKLALQEISHLILSTNEVERSRGYRALLLFPALMLRPAPRGGKKGFSIWKNRFQLFFAGKFGQLLQETIQFKESRPDAAELQARRIIKSIREQLGGGLHLILKADGIRRANWFRGVCYQRGCRGCHLTESHLKRSKLTSF
jgi:hypothetical protein